MTIPAQFSLTYAFKKTLWNAGLFLIVAGLLLGIVSVVLLALKCCPSSSSSSPSDDENVSKDVAGSILAILAVLVAVTGGGLIVKSRWFTDNTIQVLKSMKEGGLFICQTGMTDTVITCDRFAKEWQNSGQEAKKIRVLLERNDLSSFSISRFKEQNQKDAWLLLVMAKSDFDRINKIEVDTIKEAMSRIAAKEYNIFENSLDKLITGMCNQIREYEELVSSADVKVCKVGTSKMDLECPESSSKEQIERMKDKTFLEMGILQFNIDIKPTKSNAI
jgi:hypothetical protein